MVGFRNCAGVSATHDDYANERITRGPGCPVAQVDDSLNSCIACGVSEILRGLPILLLELPSRSHRVDQVVAVCTPAIGWRKRIAIKTICLNHSVEGATRG